MKCIYVYVYIYIIHIYLEKLLYSFCLETEGFVGQWRITQEWELHSNGENKEILLNKKCHILYKCAYESAP